MPRAVIATGTGRYADPWHPFAATAQILASLLEADGWQVTVDDDLDGALTRLEGVRLLVVSAGDPWHGGETGVGRADAATAGLRDALDHGIGVIAVHIALATLRDDPQWREAIGGAWVEGHSWHADIGEVTVRVVDDTHPVTADLGEIVVFDELYTDLVIDTDVHVLAEHELDGVAHPLVWVRSPGSARVVVSALGHDERSFASPSHRQLLVQAARWAGRR